MQQASLKLTTAQPAPLVVVKDRSAYDKQVDHLATIAWQIAYTALWNGETFSYDEKRAAFNAIREFIRQDTNPLAAYSEFTERTVLAKLYIQAHNHASPPVPSRWLDTSNGKGFAATMRWYKHLVEMRQSLPLHRIQIKSFGEAVLQTVQSGLARDYHQWRSYFITQSCHGLANLFCSTMANYRYMLQNL